PHHLMPSSSFTSSLPPCHLHSFPTRRSSDLFLTRTLSRTPSQPATTIPTQAEIKCCLPVATVSPQTEMPISEPGSSRTVSAQTPDRKSTRLNSSHQIISYAVFCLKKKNK